jgi:hypothetical protein
LDQGDLTEAGKLAVTKEIATDSFNNTAVLAGCGRLVGITEDRRYFHAVQRLNL